MARLLGDSEADLRRQARASYRLLRRGQARFFAKPNQRGGDARARMAALRVLSRRAQETAALAEEKSLAEKERDRLASARSRNGGAVSSTPWAGHPPPAVLMGPALSGAAPPELALAWPTKGTVVGTPGVKRDPATFARWHLGGIQILARKNAVIRAVARGVVSKTAALPQGGYAVVTTLEDGSIAVLSGLRTLEAVEGAPVDGGERLGLLGRNLDGAPILDFEYWVAGAPVDPRPQLGARPYKRPSRRSRSAP